MSSRIFISHAAEDLVHCEHLERHLRPMQRQELISVWHRRMVRPGEDITRSIRRELEAADLIVLLLSADFLASDDCTEEAARAMVRHNAGAARVVPIVVRPVDLASTPFQSIMHLPPDGCPVTTAADVDQAWTQVIRGIRSLVTGSAPPEIPRPAERAPRVEPGARSGRAGLLAAAAIGIITISAGVIWMMVRARGVHELQGQIQLLWAPADCDQKEPKVVYASCTDLRGLAWLQGEMNFLRASGVRGFAELPRNPKLDPASSEKKESWLLYTYPENGGRRFLVAVGYRHEDASKDGCLRLYESGTQIRRSATACLTRDGRWWTQDEDGGPYRPLER